MNPEDTKNTDTPLEVTFLVTIGKDGKADMRLKDPDSHDCRSITPKPVSFPTESMSIRAFSNSGFFWVCHQADHTWHLYTSNGLGGFFDLGHVGNYQC